MWNIKTTYEGGKIHNAIREMDRLSIIDIMGISKMRWTNFGQCLINDHQIYYSGNTRNEDIHGVGIILNKNIPKITNFVPISERIFLFR